MSRYEWTRGPLPAPPSASDFHRRQVTSLLAELAPATGGKLAVLGAGPCHDLDLPALQSAWAQIDLVDIDPERVEQGVAAQVAQPTGIRMLEQDLLLGKSPNSALGSAGASALGSTLAPAPANPASSTSSRDPLAPGDPRPSLRQPEVGIDLRQQIATATWDALDSDYDAVVSTCLLSQLIKTVVDQLGQDHALFVPTIRTLRQRHLEQMAQVLRPGGTGLLLADFVSSDTLPELFEATPQNLPDLLGKALQTQNFFHGMNPGMILKVAREEAPLNSLISTVQMSPPWVWRTGNMAYAVVAIKFLRTSADDRKAGDS